MTKIEELEQKIETINIVLGNLKLELENYEKALAELKESKKEGKWKPTLNQEYWFRSASGVLEVSNWEDDELDNGRYNNITLFPTKEKCERYWHFMDTVKEKSYSFSEEEWLGYGIRKYFIYYDYRVEQVKIGDEYATKDFNKPYFKTEEDAQYIIDNFKDELMEYLV